MLALRFFARVNSKLQPPARYAYASGRVASWLALHLHQCVWAPENLTSHANVSAQLIADVQKCIMCDDQSQRSTADCRRTVLHRERQIENSVSSKVAWQQIRQVVDKHII